MTSPDGVTWTTRTSAADNAWFGVCWSPERGLFVAVAFTGTGNRVMTSPDGVTWTARTSAANNSWRSVCWSPQLSVFVAVATTGSGNRVMTSPDGVTWTARTPAADNSWYSVCWSPELSVFAAVATDGVGVMTSAIGVPASRSALLVSPAHASVDASTGTVAFTSAVNVQGSLAVQGGTLAPQVAGSDPGDMLVKRYGVGDRYGFGQYGGGTTRIFTASNHNQATVRISSATDDVRGSAAGFADHVTVMGSGTATAGNVGIGTTAPAFRLDVNGTFRANGGSKLTVQNGQEGGSSRGIYMWSEGDNNWGIYMSPSGASRSLADGTAVAGADFTTHAIRLRVNNNANNGIIFENASEQRLLSVRGSDGSTAISGALTVGGTVTRTIPIMARRHSTSQTITNMFTTRALFDTQDVLNSGTTGLTYSAGVFTNTSGSTRTFLINVMIAFSANVTGQRIVWIHYNGEANLDDNTKRYGYMDTNAATGGVELTIIPTSAVLTLANNETFTINCWQNSGASLTIGGNGGSGVTTGYGSRITATLL
jgi:hypothetical protein